MEHKLFADGTFVQAFVSWQACVLEAKARSLINPSARYVAIPCSRKNLKSRAFVAGASMNRTIDVDGSVIWSQKS